MMDRDSFIAQYVWAGTAGVSTLEHGALNWLPFFVGPFVLHGVMGVGCMESC